MMNPSHAKRVLETALICARQPLNMSELSLLFEGQLDPPTIKQLLSDLSEEWQTSGVELVGTSIGWRFQSRSEMRVFIERLNPEKPVKYSRAVLETLAIIAYKQPVTRGDIEDIRGVAVGSQIIKQLEERNWIETIGHRDAIGRPALYATTRQFLDDIGLRALNQLPPIEAVGESSEHVTSFLSAEIQGCQLPLIKAQEELDVDTSFNPSLSS